MTESKSLNPVDEVYEFLKKNKPYFLATVDADGNPQVRPFGSLSKIDGSLYIQTGNVKPCFKQLAAHPRVAICCHDAEEGAWLRIEADAVADERREARKAMLDDAPHLRNMYDEDDGVCEAVKLSNVTASFCSFTSEPRTVTF